jgi:uncharacterized protein YecA (UPF0149 family)
MADTSQTHDPFEMLRRLWGPLGLPAPGMAMPTLDPKEIEKRISDLRSVEAWLSMNLNMVRFSIQGLELQKAALNAMRAAGEAGAQAASAGAPGTSFGEMAADAASSAASTLFWPWAMMQQAMAASAAQPGAAQPGEPAPEGGGKK